MPEYRKLHNNFDMGERTSQLTDFEFRVWSVYRAAADDFGVCPLMASTLKGRSRRLSMWKNKPVPDGTVLQAMHRLIAIGLCLEFTHQGLRYLCQADWQDREDIRHPRSSNCNPPPTPDVFGQLTELTRNLFRNFHPKCRVSGRAGGQETPTLTETQTPTVPPEESRETKPALGRALIVSPIEWHRKHGAVHVTEFCDWVCLPNEMADGFAKKVTGVPFEQARAQVLEWAREIRRQWHGRVVPDGSDFDFWRHRWTETHGGSKPHTGPKGDGLDALRTVVKHG